MSRDGRRVPNGASLTERLLFRRSLTSSGCWEWTGALTTAGYGSLRIAGKSHYSHRLAWEIWRGPIPDGHHVDHLCRNTTCFNPDHLEPVLPRDNILRGECAGAIAQRRDSCIYGHPYPEASYMHQGKRQCRWCKRIYNRAHASMAPAERKQRKVAGLPVVDLASLIGKAAA